MTLSEVQVSERRDAAVKLFWVFRELSDEAMRRGMPQKQIKSRLAGHGVETLKLRMPRRRTSWNLQRVRDYALSTFRKKTSKDGVVILLWCEEKFSTFAFFPNELAFKILVLGYLDITQEARATSQNSTGSLRNTPFSAPTWRGTAAKGCSLLSFGSFWPVSPLP